MRSIVLGSGAAAVAAAAALHARGSSVLVVDAGLDLDLEGETARARMGLQEPHEWSVVDRETLRRGAVATARGLPSKRLFGSDFTLRTPSSATQLVETNARVTRSFGLGGLSNIWGACVLPYPEVDLDGWPAEARALDAHYRAVARLMPTVGMRDALEATFPLHGDTLGPPALSPLARELLSDLERSRRVLGRAGMEFGVARVAYENTNNECRQCGMCLYGCPYDLIYSARHSLERLRAAGVDYRPGCLAVRFEEHESRVSLHVRHLHSGRMEVLRGDRLFVAAGVMGTAEVVLRSLEAFDKRVSMRHSDRFVLPLLRSSGVKRVDGAAFNTLCQLFLEIAPKVADARSIHLQFYTYNDLMEQALGKGAARLLPQALRASLLDRLVVAFGYLHSDSSQSLDVSLGRTDGVLRVTGRPNSEAAVSMWRVFKLLLRHTPSTRMAPLRPRLDPPGGGNHTGGTFPMTGGARGSLETDVLGRLPGLERTHIVDASVMPSLPGATIMFPSMANAHRIASTCDL